MAGRPNWHGRPTRLPGGGWGVRIQHVPATGPPRPGDMVRVQARRRRNWTARITAIEETSRLSVVRTTGPAEDPGHQSLFEAEPSERAASAEDDALETLRETAETLRAAAAALRAAQLDGEHAYLSILSALYHAEDDQGCNLVEAHQILRFSLPSRNASDHALYGAAQVLEAATDALFGATNLFEQIRWLDAFGEKKAAGTLRAAIAGLNVAGLLEAAGDTVREATALLATPDNPNGTNLNEGHREQLLTLRAICSALRRALRNARQARS